MSYDSWSPGETIPIVFLMWDKYTQQAVAADAAPVISIYDPTGTVVLEEATMETTTETGQYILNYPIPADGPKGCWNYVITATAGVHESTEYGSFEVV